MFVSPGAPGGPAISFACLNKGQEVCPKEFKKDWEMCSTDSPLPAARSGDVVSRTEQKQQNQDILLKIHNKSGCVGDVRVSIPLSKWICVNEVQTGVPKKINHIMVARFGPWSKKDKKLWQKLKKHVQKRFKDLSVDFPVMDSKVAGPRGKPFGRSVLMLGGKNASECNGVFDCIQNFFQDRRDSTVLCERSLAYSDMESFDVDKRPWELSFRYDKKSYQLTVQPESILIGSFIPWMKMVCHLLPWKAMGSAGSATNQMVANHLQKFVGSLFFRGGFEGTSQESKINKIELRSGFKRTSQESKVEEHRRCIERTYRKVELCKLESYIKSIDMIAREWFEKDPSRATQTLFEFHRTLNSLYFKTFVPLENKKTFEPLQNK